MGLGWERQSFVLICAMLKLGSTLSLQSLPGGSMIDSPATVLYQ
jgi:hypothetical protein